MIYLIGSLRNKKVVQFGVEIRNLGYEVFDEWVGSGETADDSWKSYNKARGRTYREGLYSFAARHTFLLDKTHLDRADTVVLLVPAGRSGFLELGYAIGKGKPSYIVFEEEPEDRWDVMLNFADRVFFSQIEFLEFMNPLKESEDVNISGCFIRRVENGYRGDHD